MLVWTHDLSVEPGATYRYRCRVFLYNPLFARSRQLLEAQQERAVECSHARHATFLLPMSETVLRRLQKAR